MSANQASQMYRELRELDSARRVARRTARHSARHSAQHAAPRPAGRHLADQEAAATDLPQTPGPAHAGPAPAGPVPTGPVPTDPDGAPTDLARETSLQAALLLVEPYVGSGGPMSRTLAHQVVGLLGGSDARAGASAPGAPGTGRATLCAALLAALGAPPTVPQQRGPHGG
ncbi:MAG TPA: hypothetical protein VGC67_13100 [Cellulomonas sp.]